MKNSFDKVDLQRWFGDNWECWVCGKNHIDCLHHIVGRNNGIVGCESSILNAAPLNNFECHLPIHGELMKKENQSKLLKKTLKYLLQLNYPFLEKDDKFLEKYVRFYD